MFLFSDVNRYAVGVVCDTLPAGQHWGGLRFLGNASQSSLTHTHISQAGIRIDENGTHILSSAIMAHDSAPLLR